MWEEGGYFKPEINPEGEPFTITLPPPNANSSLHLGNALYVIEDILIRFERMRGKAALWVPGVDHAGIQTQAVFEKKLAREQNKTRYDLGRQEFHKQIYQFCLDCKLTIENQLRAMGFSLDWSREKFTLDPKISTIIYETFVKLYNDKLIYRGHRVINWCTKDYTTLSDQELEEKEQEDKLYFLNYGVITIATTRPETIFADVAVAVNPKDKKYKKLIGQKAIVPIINKEIPIIADDLVEMEFGTGALKVTPGHDIMDYEIGQKHNLETISIINFNGKMNLPEQPLLNNLKIAEAREKTVELLGDKLIKIETLKHSVKVCERCKTIIEPLISRQWFVKIKPLAEKAIEAVKNGKVKFVPKRWNKQYYHWMENLRDWPVSRQIWWGHQMPVYYCTDCQDKEDLENPIVSVEPPTGCPTCHGKNIVQDPDTFDTWFSSGQWPYTTLMTGQPGDFKKHYPTDVLDTGWEIFWLWVTRMIMFGLYVNNEVPFKNVIAHGMLRDEKGQKMSKSKGNGVDPIEMIEKYGADATRMSLVAGRDITTDWMISKTQLEEKIRGYRNFANKLWNIARFVIETDKKEDPIAALQGDTVLENKIKALIKSTTKNIDGFKFGQASDDLYQFTWHEFADKYLEDYKKNLISYEVLLLSFETLLKLLHPFMPFVTEEIWGLMPRKNNLPLIISPWPKA